MVAIDVVILVIYTAIECGIDGVATRVENKENPVTVSGVSLNENIVDDLIMHRNYLIKQSFLFKNHHRFKICSNFPNYSLPSTCLHSHCA